MEKGYDAKGGEPSPEIVVVKSPVRLSEDSLHNISRFTTSGEGMGGTSIDMLERQIRTKHGVNVRFGPGFEAVPPLDSEHKKLEIILVSFDGNKAVLAGNIHHKDPTKPKGLGEARADFALIVNTNQKEQDVDVLVSEPGSVTHLIDKLALEL